MGRREKRTSTSVHPAVWVLAAIACVCLLGYGISELRHVDMVMAIFATATPTPSPTPLPTPSPTPRPSPIPTPTPIPTPSPLPTPVPTAVEHKLPYYVEIDIGGQVVSVYTVGETGHYDLLCQQFICSTSNNGKFTSGTFQLQKWRKEWVKSVVPGYYMMYFTRISGPFGFHAVPYRKPKRNAMSQGDYRKLGKRASGGCIRLCARDAFWIYNNLPPGTPVRIVKNEMDPELLDTLRPPELERDSYWDPTDDHPKNPFYIASTPRPVVTPALGVTPAPTNWGFKK